MIIKIKSANTILLEQTISGTSLSVGRGADNDIIVPHETLSRHHCRIEMSEGDYYVTDLSSANGVLIDGQRLNPSEKTLYKTFQKLEFGLLECEIIPNPEAPALSMPFQVLTERRPPLPSLEAPPGRQRNLRYFLLAGLLLMSAVTAVMLHERQEPAVSISPLQKKKPPPPVLTEGYKSRQTYAELFFKKSCSGKAQGLCREMNLKPKKGEGAYVEGGDIVIYFKPSVAKLTQDHPQTAALPDGFVLLSLYSLIKTLTFRDLLDGEVSQIHLVLVDQNGKLDKVFLFNKNKLKDYDQSKVLNDLIAAIKKNNSRHFWGQDKNYFRFLEIRYMENK